MKKFFFSVALMATSLVASAQFATSNGGSSFGATTTSAEVSEHSSYYVQYNSFGVGEYADALDDMVTGFFPEYYSGKRFFV